jgi:hypothetical protein
MLKVSISLQANPWPNIALKSLEHKAKKRTRLFTTFKRKQKAKKLGFTPTVVPSSRGRRPSGDQLSFISLSHLVLYIQVLFFHLNLPLLTLKASIILKILSLDQNILPTSFEEINQESKKEEEALRIIQLLNHSCCILRGSVVVITSD